MKSLLYIGIMYICLSLLLISCSESDPEPACIQAEVVGPDCENGWYILKLKNETANLNCEFVGQLQSGFVTTDNLPDVYKEPGRKIGLELDINGEYSPRCVTITVMYPAVRVKRVCDSTPSVAD